MRVPDSDPTVFLDADEPARRRRRAGERTVLPARREPHSEEIVPYTEEGGGAAGPGAPSHVSEERGIGEGHRFAHPSEEFPHWEKIKEAAFEEFVARAKKPDTNPAAEQEAKRYYSMVNAVVTQHPQWGVRNIDLPRLVELLRVYQFGYGPLEDYMHIAGLEELYFNRYDQGFYIVRGEKKRIKDQLFADTGALVAFAQHVARENGLEINAEKPNLDATLKDGSRLNATLEPPAHDGPDLIIRRFRDIPFTIQQYVDTGMLTAELADDLREWVQVGFNIVVSGGTSSGKTSFLNTIGNAFIPRSDRVIVIESNKELQIATEDTKYFITREDATRENRSSDIGVKDLVRMSLRKRPDRIIVGEVRGGEAYYALVAWNSGHEGSFCTIHADNAASAIDKLEQLAMENEKLSEEAVRKLISRAVDVVVQVEEIKGHGKRQVVEVVQVYHPRKYNRRLRGVVERVAKLESDPASGAYQPSAGSDLWLLPLYERDGDNQLVKHNELIPVQGKS